MNRIDTFVVVHCTSFFLLFSHWKNTFVILSGVTGPLFNMWLLPNRDKKREINRTALLSFRQRRRCFRLEQDTGDGWAMISYIRSRPSYSSPNYHMSYFTLLAINTTVVDKKLTMALTSLDRREVSFPDMVPSKNAISCACKTVGRVAYTIKIQASERMKHCR